MKLQSFKIVEVVVEKDVASCEEKNRCSLLETESLGSIVAEPMKRLSSKKMLLLVKKKIVVCYLKINRWVILLLSQ